jgi:hypothetical protein
LFLLVLIAFHSFKMSCAVGGSTFFISTSARADSILDKHRVNMEHYVWAEFNGNMLRKYSRFLEIIGPSRIPTYILSYQSSKCGHSRPKSVEVIL